MKFVLPDGNGVYQEVTIRETDKGVVVDMVSKEDVTAIIEDNKRQQSEGKQYLGKGTQSSMYKLGQLSALKAHELIKVGIFQDDKKLRQWFGDLDNYLWRTVAKKRKGNVQNLQTR